MATQLGKILSLPARPVTPSSDELEASAGRERRARWVVLALILGSLGLYWGGVALFGESSRAGIERLPPQTRRGLYLETLNEVATICRGDAATTGDLRDHCVEEARFLVRLPDCGEACQRAAQAVLPHARR